MDADVEQHGPDQWDPLWQKRCVVCGKETDGKALCDDDRCARELAEG